MKLFSEFLAEAFPPQNNQKKPFPPKKAGSGQKPPFVKKGAPTEDAAEGEMSADDEQLPGQEEPFMDDEAQDDLVAMQQAQAEQEKQEQLEREQKAAEEKAKIENAKKLRLAAEKEVADALNDKFNDDEDEVVFYPSLDSFSNWQDKKDKEKQEEEDEKGEKDEESVDGDDDSEDIDRDAEDDGDDSRDDSDDDGEDADSDNDGADDEESEDDDVESDDDEEDAEMHPEKDDKEKKLKKKVVKEDVARLQVRSSTYRDRGGFTISGRDTKGRRVKIFVRSQNAAERVKAAINAGRDVDYDALKEK